MNVLFVHNNFPAQFRHLAARLANEPGISVAAIGAGTAQSVADVQLVKYSLDRADVSATHPFARRFDLECRRAEQVLYALSTLRSKGFIPDVVVAHPGWGETIPIRTMCPDAKLVLYCEFFYGAQGRDFGFDPEFPSTGLDGQIGLQVKNAATLLGLEDCELGISPTAWQRSTFPVHYQSKIRMSHEGVDTDVVKPDADAVVSLPDGSQLSARDEVVTFVSRDLEPLRGYHTFMRALPSILMQRPHARVLIVGGEGTSYGAQPPAGTSWKTIFFEEVADRIDLNRVHFLGRLGYAEFIKVLQVSSAHVYFTYPFVLSWSCLEAMSAGCVVVGSDTAPVQEVIDGSNGILVPFFDVEMLAERVVEVLACSHRYAGLREAARRYVVDNFDLTRVCLPQMMSLVYSLRSSPQAASGRVVWPARKKRRPSIGVAAE
jgi:glycosyltransferase involved in cell wall biosynthesis